MPIDLIFVQAKQIGETNVHDIAEPNPQIWRPIGQVFDEPEFMIAHHEIDLSILVRGNMTVEDKYLAAQIGAVEMVSKGCTACYDLFYEFPAPTVEGLNAVAQGYLDVGMRAVVAPMMADRTFYEAVPGLMEALPEALRAEIENAPRLAPWETSLENASHPR